MEIKMKDVKDKIIEHKAKDIKEDSITFDIETHSFSNEQLLTDESELDKKNISYIEKEVRNSIEYRSYIQYLKNELDLKSCALLPNLDSKELGISLEFHHFPMNLYEISQTVAMSKLEEEGEVSYFDIAEDIVKEHYLNNIGLVPLSQTMHEMAHNKSILIPKESINGNYNAFVAKYSDFISDDIKQRISDMELYNSSDDAETFNKQKTKKTVVNYKIDYQDVDEEKED